MLTLFSASPNLSVTVLGLAPLLFAYSIGPKIVSDLRKARCVD